MKVVVFYIGSSLLAPLKQAEQEIARDYKLKVSVAAYNFGVTLNEDEWAGVESDLREANVVFVIHVMDGENAARLIELLERVGKQPDAIIVINCMPELMRRTRMGRLDFGQLFKSVAAESGEETASGKKAKSLAGRVGAWVGEQARARGAEKSRGHGQYLKLADRLPSLLRFVPSAGKLRDIKHYLYLFCYFLQPTPANIRSMMLYALKHYTGDARLSKIRIPPPESMPVMALYHPDAPKLFETFEAYRKWYERRGKKNRLTLAPEETIGLLLMRPQIVSRTRRHYDGLIRAIEAEGMNVLPAISTFMDNREACAKFFVEEEKSAGKKQENGSKTSANGNGRARVSQIVSLTGFSFVGGPAMNDSASAVRFLNALNRPFRSAISLDMQTIESWQESLTGLNPVQAGMQISIPELDGATEPFVFGGMTAKGFEPQPIEERCQRFARRLKNWNRLRTAERANLKLALVIFCFPPNKGNIGTAADLDVFPSIFETLAHLKSEGYMVEIPRDADSLRESLLGGNSENFGATTNVAARLTVDEYRRLCPYVEEIEKEWGPAPGEINSFGGRLFIQGLQLGNVLLAVQPTFGYEGDPMRLLMARSGSPHHGFAALYTYLEKVFCADAVIHFGTHGALEFMPGKQVGLSEYCWPDRLAGTLPHLYIYSVNNPSEGTIAKRRSYAELISYLTPPIENAGLYKDFASLKELLMAYRQSANEREREQLFASIEETARALNL